MSLFLTNTGFLLDNSRLGGDMGLPPVTAIGHIGSKQLLKAQFGIDRPPTRIDELHHQWVHQEPVVKTYKYLKEVMYWAGKVLGDDVVSFIRLQIKNPYLSHTNREYLYDIMRVLVGQQRHTTISTYQHVISPAMMCYPRNQSPKQAIPEPLNTLWVRFISGEHRCRPKDMTMLMYWVTKPSGLDDIIWTLYILLGRYDA